MRILFTRFPLESRFGGAEVQTLALMRGLKEKNHEVMFLGSCSVLLEETEKLEMRNWKFKIGPPPVTKWHAISFLWRQFTMRKKLHSEFRIPNSELPGAVCMLSLTEKLLLTPYLHAQGVKVIWIEHDRVGPWLTWNPWLPKLRRLSSLATTVVVSDLSKKIYEDLGFQNVVAIPNGIDVSRLNQGQSHIINRKSSMFHVGTIARLTYDKGVDVLIDAVKDLPDISLTIVGTGSEEKNLHSKKLINQKTEIIPSVNNLAKFYSSIDVFVLPSRSHDPFGLVAGEAMMMGIPVIVTDVCGIASYLTNGNDAVIVPAGSSNALRNAIAALQLDPQKREMIGKEGVSSARQLFSLERMIERYERVLSENKKEE